MYLDALGICNNLWQCLQGGEMSDALEDTVGMGQDGGTIRWRLSGLERNWKWVYAQVSHVLYHRTVR